MSRGAKASASLTLLASCSLLLVSACEEAATQPPTFRVAELEGSPYERGFQHGERFGGEIRELYARMLTSSILPYLNRERPAIAALLTEYQGPAYDDGQFSYQLMLDSALSMERSIPPEYVEEMQGIADGAGLPYEQILVLNTFVDTMLSLRALTFFIRDMAAPRLVSVSWGGGLESDGVDNDGDGEVDETGEGTLEPYEPSPHAAMVEVPPETEVRFLVVDQAGAEAELGADQSREPEGVAPETIRIQVDTEVLGADDPRIETRQVPTELGEALEVTLRPGGGFEPASVTSLLFQVGDRALQTDPPPAHANFMRDERIVFTTLGFGQPAGAVENRGERDGRTQPPSIAFAARGSATAGGEPLLAHHFAMLDVDASHEHTVLFVHRVDRGIDHVVLGWTGLVWGFSGMNAEGLSYGVTPADSLDATMAVDVLIHRSSLASARLRCQGIPIGIMGRAILSETERAEEAADWLAPSQRTFGWNMLLADRRGEMLAVEMDSSILGDGGFEAYSVADSPEGHAVSSVGPDDLRLASHYVSNTEDLRLDPIRPQRYWSRFYFRSMRAFYILGDRIEASYGGIDVPSAIAILRDPDLVDAQDSMSAVVFEPASGRLHVAMGQVPATDGEFLPFDLADLFGKGGWR